MLECVDNAVSRILAERPRHLLEIGCGTGLLLYRLVPHCVGLPRHRPFGASDRTIACEPGTGWTFRGSNRAELRVQRAEDFSDIAPGSFDTIVINSVVQYFPGVDYLIEVLSQAVERCASGRHDFYRRRSQLAVAAQLLWLRPMATSGGRVDTGRIPSSHRNRSSPKNRNWRSRPPFFTPWSNTFPV